MNLPLDVIGLEVPGRDPCIAPSIDMDPVAGRPAELVPGRTKPVRGRPSRVDGLLAVLAVILPDWLVDGLLNDVPGLNIFTWLTVSV